MTGFVVPAVVRLNLNALSKRVQCIQSFTQRCQVFEADVAAVPYPMRLGAFANV